MDQFEALLAPAVDPAAPSPTLADRIATATGQAFAWLVVVAILLSVYEVMMRYVFGAPSSWVLATTTTLCQIGFALGGAFCMARREHIRISYFPDQMGPRTRWFAELFSLVIGAFYLCGLLYAVYLDARTSIWKFDFQGRWAPELTPGPPNWPLPSLGKAGLVIGAALFLAVVLSHLVAHLRRPRR
ncbi:TRAP transporter small permease subunit [Bosea sp. R86505]|uniref:TRAP transporter small permease subunit n=1 Tax=Bosea sp. R86505 TaxID=3101710 RepID=UPI00367331F3